ncbi:three component ABC system middle component [Paenibacillus sp. FSL H8-0537]|uniref:three component ABC system middle component n=1 Tax=Paenibacillus sp. FSL H8-0537 TaxID=2921399 RepID=UPI003101645E
MTRVHEFDAVQNQALGALLLWTFVAEYFKVKGENEGPTLPHMMLVLPILFNQDFVENIYKRNFKGGLYNALNEDMSLFAGVQNRMQAMSDLTLRSINFCCSARIVLIDKESYEFIPVRSKIQNFKHNESIHKMLAAAKRLGHWFAINELNQICALLKVRF